MIVSECALRRVRRLASTAVVASTMLLAVTSCRSPEVDERERSAELRQLYPPGSTTRADVQAKWESAEPGISVVRPAAGWQACPNESVRDRVLEVEARTWESVLLAERYWGPDGLFSLCYCWFYYDAEDRLVDVEWQYCSD